MRHGTTRRDATRRDGAQSVARRLKELVAAAAGGDISEWELVVTGHSLGGALATLFTMDLAEVRG